MKVVLLTRRPKYGIMRIENFAAAERVDELGLRVIRRRPSERIEEGCEPSAALSGRPVSAMAGAACGLDGPFAVSGRGEAAGEAGALAGRTLSKSRG